MFTILLTQSYAVEGRHEMAALSGFVSLWFRQTNIVWIFLLAGLCCLSVSVYYFCIKLINYFLKSDRVQLS